MKTKQTTEELLLTVKSLLDKPNIIRIKAEKENKDELLYVSNLSPYNSIIIKKTKKGNYVKHKNKFFSLYSKIILSDTEFEGFKALFEQESENN